MLCYFPRFTLTGSIMYRLLRRPVFKISKLQLLTANQVHLHTQVCSLCGISSGALNHNLQKDRLWGTKQSLCIRHHGTKTDRNFVSELTKRKRFIKDKKHFTDVLEVYDNSTVNETKTRIQHLKPKDISRIVRNPNVDLDHLHYIKKQQTKNKMKMPDSKETISSNNFFEHGLADEDEVFKLYDQASYKTTPEINNPEGRYFSTNAKLANNKSKKGLTELQLLSRIQKGKERDVEAMEEEAANSLLVNFHIPPDHDVFSPSPNHPGLNRNTLEDLEFCNDEDVEHVIAPNDNKKTDHSKNAFEELKRKVQLKKNKREKLERDKLNALENMCKEKSFNTTLYSYLSLCVSCNFLQRGLATLHHYIYRSKMSKNQPKVTDIRIFEVLMQAFAAKGNTNKVNELWKMVSSVGLNPSINMFSSSLESAARSPRNQHMVAEIINALKDSGFTLNDIFVKCTFLGDQRDIILRTIKELEPQFEPEVPPPVICYSCSLLQEINVQGRNTELRSPAEGLISKGEIKQLVEEQLNNEFLFNFKVKSIEKRIESPSFLEANRQKLNEMRESWMTDLNDAFKRDVSIMETVRKHSSISLLPYLKVLDQEDYVDIMMKEVQRLAEGSETFSPHTAQLYRYLGTQIRNRYVIKFKKTHGILDKTKMLYNKYCDWFLDPSLGNHRSCNGRQEWQQLIYENQSGPSIVGEEEYWPSTVMLTLGKFLYNIIVADVKIDVNIFNRSTKQQMLPAFYRVYRNQSYKVLEEIKPHPVISKLFRSAGEEYISFDITLVPMLSPPLPWTSYQSGGYLMSKTDFIRLPDQALQQRQRLKEAPSVQLHPSLDSLNQLGSIPWKVNVPVLDTVIDVFNNGGSSKLDIPEPSYLCPMAEPVNSTMTKQERFQAYRQRMLLRRQKAEMYSLWCDALYKLSLANHFRDRIFWLPHNMDFRGRVYPCPPHLNHLGADMSRSLLCFAQGKPLGPSGLDWLKIHLVNLLGTKKRDSIQARLDFANSILPEIIDSAEKPLTGMKWWMDSEEPWQTLACCMEIRAALTHSEGPEQFVSHFPVHQDGSCNGLQHYAALGRDEAGASSVNLMPQSLPQDVYTCVANLVERERAKDSAAGVKVATELDGFVRRKVIKQTVMTTVYGVTRFGARLQIARQLKDIDSFPKEYVWPASTYLVVKTFESLREMFNSTKEIQDWFTECARLIAQVRGQNTEYVTPLGLPVVQHYSRQAKKPLFSINSFGILQEYFPIDMFEKPNVMKQKNAFPPNFIHSLDSSHMMLTSIFSEQKGITFVSVHDCYWTHPSTIHIMNQICREQFVALHSQPILENLSEFMLQKYGYCASELDDQNQNVSKAKAKLQRVLSQVPPKGKFRIENVLGSIYFFS